MDPDFLLAFKIALGIVKHEYSCSPMSYALAYTIVGTSVAISIGGFYFWRWLFPASLKVKASSKGGSFNRDKREVKHEQAIE